MSCPCSTSMPPRVSWICAGRATAPKRTRSPPTAWLTSMSRFRSDRLRSFEISEAGPGALGEGQVRLGIQRRISIIAGDEAHKSGRSNHRGVVCRERTDGKKYVNPTASRLIFERQAQLAIRGDAARNEIGARRVLP